MSSFSILRLRSEPISITDLRSFCNFLLEYVSAELGVKGTRNLRHDLSSAASLELIVEACCLVPRRERRSVGDALGVGEGEEEKV